MQWLARKLTGKNDLAFVEEIALQPADTFVSAEMQKEMEAELAAADNVALPDDDDDL